MSRGPGRIELAIEGAFAGAPDSIFLTDDLALIAYPGIDRVEKKHRVAVLRAADKVGRRLWWAGYRTEKFGGQVVWCNLCDLHSYALGRMRSDFLYNALSLDDLKARLVDPKYQYQNWRKNLNPGGAWHTLVELYNLRRAGKIDEAKAKSEAWQKALQAEMRALSAQIGR